MHVGEQILEVERIVEQAGHAIADVIHADQPDVDYLALLLLVRGELRSVIECAAVCAPDVTR